MHEMKPARIVHLCPAEKFIPPFIDFVRKHFGVAEHMFIVWGGDRSRYPIVCDARIIVIRSLVQLPRLVRIIQSAERIMLHGLFNNRLNALLAVQTWVLPKCYWFVWGWDLYVYQRELIWGEPPDLRWKISEFFRRRVIRRIGHLVSAVRGDLELAKQWYGARGEWHDCLMYLSNLWVASSAENRSGRGLRILVGNSGDPSNEHLEVFARLSALEQQEFTVYVPLSYGRANYIEDVLEAGKRMFGERFRPVMGFMPKEEYTHFISNIDVAIFNHRRQQAMGNIINCLGLGKKVYLRREVTTYRFLEALGLQVFDATKIDCKLLESQIAERNGRLVREYFSEERLKRQLADLFN